jgi:hypothetical protein
MRRQRNISQRKDERGVIITLVAVFMLGIVAAMAALSIDVVTIYTARSEAQLAADGAALAGARVLANSGMTSASTPDVGVDAIPLAITVATQVAANNKVGGRNLIPGASTCVTGQEICVSINQSPATFVPNPQVLVTVQRTDLPTFFARIWGRAAVTVRASATAEAYNPSNLSGTSTTEQLPVAPTCVKPWLLPNLSPATTGSPIFNPNGSIADATLLGWETPGGGGIGRLVTDCTTNCATPQTPTAWQYYPGTTDPTTGSFPAPSASSAVCPGCSGFTNANYQLAIAGCVQPPISCSSLTTGITVDISQDSTRDDETGVAVNGLTYTTGNAGDSVDPSTPNGPFQFLSGNDNPVVRSGSLPAGTDVMISNSLVTVPVIDITGWPQAIYPNVQIIGFVQLFLNPSGRQAFNGHIHTKVVNLVGCGTGMSTLQPILGNGASPVAVRLISASSS